LDKAGENATEGGIIMKLNIEQKIINSRPEKQPNKTVFVDKTMQAIKSASVNETFGNVLRTTNVTKKETFKMKYERLQWKFKHLSTASLVALLLFGAVFISGTAYAAYRILGPVINITERNISNDDQKRQYTVDISNCGEVIGGTPIGDGLRYFEVARDSNLSEEQIKKVLHDTCEYQAMFEFANSHWTQEQDLNREYKKGETIKTYGFLNNNQLAIGKIKSIDKESISIETTTYESYENIIEYGDNFEKVPTPDYFPDGKTVTETYALNSALEVWHDEEKTSLEKLSPGDTVYLYTVNEVKLSVDSDLSQVGEHPEFDINKGETSVIGILRANLDTSYVQSYSIGNPAIVGSIVQLVGCQGLESKDFLCTSTNSTHLNSEAVYAVEATNEIYFGEKKIEKGDSYYRKDIPNEKMSEATVHEVEGRIVSMKGTEMTLRTRGKIEKIQIFLPYNVIGSYNQNNKVKLEIGDYIELYYEQYPDENELVVKPGDISRISYLNYLKADGSLKKY
jgi:hypothetical protein